MAINKTLRLICISALFLIPFVALVVSSSQFFPYITGKNFVFRILAEIALVSWAALAFRDASYRPRWKSPIVMALALFMIVIFLADLFGQYFFKSFWSNFERMEGYISFLHLSAYFFAASAILNSKKLWNRFFHTFFAIGILLGFMGLYQHFHGGVERIDATLGNSTYLGALMIFNIFLLLIYLIRSFKNRGPNWKYLSGGYALATLFDIYILTLTGTRGALLGLIGGFIFIAVVLAFSKKEERVLRYAGRGLLGLMVIVFILIASLQNTSVFKNHPSFSRLIGPVNAVLTLDFNGFLEKEGRGRLLIWQAALKGVKERPILGWGQENFNYIFNKYYTPEMYTEEQWFDRSHNVILDWFTQGGVLGLLSYLALFGALIYGLWKKTANDFSLEERAVLNGLLIAYFIHNFFVFDNITSYILFFAVLAYVNRVQFEATADTSARRAIHPDIANYALSPIVIIVALCGLFFGVYRPYTTSTYIIHALTDTQSGNAALILNDYKKALTPHTLGAPEAREQLLTLLPSVVAAPTVDAATKQSFIDFTKAQITDQLKRTPQDARYFLFYGSALDRIGTPPELVEAQGYLEKAQELSPAKQTILFELGFNYLAQGNNDKAIDILKKTYESAPAYNEAQVNYIIGLIYAAKYNDAEALRASANKSVLGDNRIIKAYYAAKQYQTVIKIYHQRQELNPADSESYLGASGFYLLINDRSNAILELQHLLDVFKKLAAQNPSDPQYQQDINAVNSYISKIKAGENPFNIQG